MLTITFADNFPEPLTHVHFIGIGGGGMSSIAQIMLQRDITISGSDLRDSEATRALTAEGAKVFEGHDAKFLSPEVDAVVVTSAMSEDNPEYLKAVELGIPVFHRSQALAWLANQERVIAIAGAHGKSTSTSMMVNALEHLGAKPSYSSGAIISDRGNNFGIGDGELFVVEADESDGSFLRYDSNISLITNVDADHLEYFGTQENFEKAFVDFGLLAQEAVVISSDDPGAVRVTQELKNAQYPGNILTFGFHPDSDVVISDFVNGLSATFSITYRGETVSGRVHVPGDYNAQNAAGIITILLALGYPLQDAVASLESYGGTKHRFDLQATVNDIPVIDDYAHHPTEVIATLKMAREITGDKKVIAVYQPKRYTRTQILAKEFAEAYENGADFVVILDIYSAMEPVIPGVTGQTVLDKFGDQSRGKYISDWDEAAKFIADLAEPGDYIISFSSGDKKMIIPQILDALEDRFSVKRVEPNRQ